MDQIIYFKDFLELRNLTEYWNTASIKELQ